MIVENVDSNARGSSPHLRVAGLVEGRDDRRGAVGVAGEVRVDHRLGRGENDARRAVGIDGSFARIAHRGPDDSERRRRGKESFSGRFHALGLAFIVLAACSGGGDSAANEGGAASADEARARSLLDDERTLDARSEVIRSAQAVVALAAKESDKARARELTLLAARLYERLYRADRRVQDAKEANDLYRTAGADLEAREGCDALVRAALLGGEVARDASVTYAELYRVYLRAPQGSGCRSRAFERMVSLASFAPPREVLVAVEQGSVGEDALRDAGATARVGAPEVTRVETYPGEDAARVVLTLDRSARFRTGEDAAEPGRGARTYVELDGVEVSDALRTARDLDLPGLVRAVHTQPVTTGTRVSLELAGPAYRRVFYLVEPYRVVVDIAKHPPGVLPKGRRVVSHVVLDPGHGGNDAGASGPAGTKEKDVTLAVAQRTSAILERAGLRVTLTRADDRYVTLEERTARANGAGADLFVSIHCNAAESKGKRGVETYVLDTTTNDIAARVAARENATSQAANAELGSILATMRLADQSARSTKLADLLQRAAFGALSLKYKDVHDGGVHQAGFYVLVGARMPAVLFETSYVSNAIEEERLASPDYQQRLADGIANAIQAYREGR